MNLVLRSGANYLHGDGFYYYRDQDFGARDPLATLKPPERRQQLGGSIAGPIRSNELFYFVNYDQQIRNFPLVIDDLNDVLTFREARAACQCHAGAAGHLRYGSEGVHRGVGFSEVEISRWRAGQSAVPHAWATIWCLGKLDYLVNSSNTLSTFFNYLRSSGERAIQTPIVLPQRGTQWHRRCADLFLQCAAHFDARSAQGERAAIPVEPRLGIRIRRPASAGDNDHGRSNPFSFGQATFLQRAALPDERRVQFVDNFSYMTGKHAFKFGGEFNRVHDLIDNPALFGGQYTYSSALAIGRDLVTPGARNYTSFQQSFGLYVYAYSTIDLRGFRAGPVEAAAAADDQLRRPLGQGGAAHAVRAESGDSGDAETAD